MTTRVGLYLMASLMALAGCTGDGSDEQGSGDHVWKEQTRTLDEARQVDNVLEDAADRARQSIDRQTQ